MTHPTTAGDRALPATLADTLAVFGADEAPGTPLTTSEVAAELDLARRSAYDRLQGLADRDLVETKKVGARGRVWWRPPADDDGTPAGNAEDAGEGPDGDEYEARLRRERDLFERVLEAAPASIVLFDADGEVLRTNARAQERLGFDAASEGYAVGDVDAYDEDGEVIPPDERPYLRVFDTGEAVRDFHCRIDLPEAGSRWVSINAVPLRDDDGVDCVVVTAQDVTRLTDQARRLERQRDDLEAELDDVFDRVDDAFFALDREWRFTHVNDHAAELLDRARADLVGEPVWDEFSPAAAATFEERYEHAMATQESVNFEAYYSPLDTWVEVSAYPSETGLSVYFRDVTERKERERELAEYEAAVETISDGVYVVDGENRFRLVNDAHAELTGYDREELLGSHASLVTDDEYVERAETVRDRLEADGRDAATVETELVTADGERVPVETRFSVIRLDDGGAGRVGVVRNVTGRKERERELELYETIVSAIEDGVYLLDEEYCFAMVNDAYVEMTGYSREELLGTHCTLVVDEAVSDESAERIAEIVDGDEEGAAIEADIHRADGTRLRAESNFTALPSADPETPRKVGVVRDVSDRVERERELQRQRHHLAALDDLNGVVRDITEAVIDRSTREEIETVVCERLAASDSYELAWIGEVDGHSREVVLRTEAGVEGYLDDITISVDPDDERSTGPTGMAILERRMQVTHDVRAAGSHDPWREHVEQYEFRSAAAIPIVHEGTLYGVLNVYAGRPGAFTGDEREVMGQLGEIVGHAIAAVERKRALMNDEVVELEFRVPDVFDAIDVAAEGDGRLELESAVPAGDDVYLVYGTASGDMLDACEAMVETLPHWDALTTLGEADGETRIELRLVEPPVLSAIASLGCHADEAVVEDGDYYLRLHAPPSLDARRVIDAVQDAHPAARLASKRQITRDDGSAASLNRVLHEELTERQLGAIEAAYFSGFFRWPRESTGEDVADSLGVSAPTFHQHVRKGQQRLLAAVLGD